MPVGRRFVRTLLLFAFFAAPLRADSVWTIPGIVNASGLNGTHFVSDLTVTNPGGAPANVTLSFFPSGSSSKALVLAPGQTVVYSDVAGVTFGVSGGAGALSVSSDQPLLIRAKTYNTAASGTYGVALPVVTSDRLLAPGDVGDSLWISQDASGSAGFRTNVAVVFPDASGGAATVTIYDADGNARGSQTFSLNAPGLQQFSVGSFAGAVSVGRARIAVTRGHVAGYAVVVDNVTGDSSLFAFEDLPGGIQDVLVNGVARASGRNGAFFRTDGRFYNPTNTDATVTVAFHAAGDSNPTPASATFTLAAGKIRDVVDVLDTLLGLPVGSSGALRFKSTWPVAILCRTSNVDPSGVRPGTFGSQQKPVPLLSFLTSADAGAAVTGIRQNAAFRTNVGFAAGADGAQYTMTLADASGATIATTTASRGVFGWSQPNVQDLFTGTTIPDNATLTVKVTNGSVDVFDSSIDNNSGDPVVTPIAPLPISIPSSATIGLLGGSIRSDDGRLTLRIPAGALASPVSMSFQTTTNDAPQGIGPGYQISPSGISFAKRALLALAYGRDDTAGSNAAALTVAANAGAGWFGLGGGSIDPLRHTLTVSLASTAPSPPASVTSQRLAGRRSLESLPFVLGETASWRIYPQGPLAILTTSGEVDFTVSYLGPSSSTDLAETIFLPTKASDAKATWFVNRIELGGNDAGSIVITGGTSATYVPPDCPPAENPVHIEATIESKGLLALPYQVSGFVAVQVVPRDWTLVWSVDATRECIKDKGGEYLNLASDHAVWTGDQTKIRFSLNENSAFPGNNPTFLVQHTFESGPSHNFQACPCNGDSKIEGLGTDTPLEVYLSGSWDSVNMRIFVHTSTGYAYEGGSVTCTYDGYKFSNGEIVEAFSFSQDLNLKKGENGTMIGAPTNEWTITVDYYLKSDCP